MSVFRVLDSFGRVLSEYVAETIREAAQAAEVDGFDVIDYDPSGSDDVIVAVER